MKKIVAGLILVAAILSFAACNNSQNNNVSSLPTNSETLTSIPTNNSAPSPNPQEDAPYNDDIIFTAADYIIEFDEAILGEAFKEAGNEIKGCEYNLSFKDGKFVAYMNFGNSVEGTYTVSDNIISCKLTKASGEYSPDQNIKGDISFKVVSSDTLQVISAPESYTVKIAEISDGEWVLTSEEKEMGLWPLVDGIRFRLSEDK